MSRFSPQTHPPLSGIRRGGSARSAALAALAVIAFVSVVGAPRRASAQDAATIDKLVQLNKKAMDDFDTADFDAAKKSLLDAEKLGKRAGLETHPVMARTYVHLGAVYLAGYKDKQKSQHYFEKALDIQSDIKLDKNMTSQSLRDAFAAAVAKRGGGAGAGAGADEGMPDGGGGRKGRRAEAADATPPEAESETESGGPKRRRGGSRDDSDADPDLPKKIVALDCPYPSDTAPGRKLVLRCAAAANLGVANVNLYYKGFEMQDYESLPMEKSPKGWWRVEVPKKHVDGKSIQFYFEGVDAADAPVVSNGRAESPNVMMIVNKALPQPRKRREEEDPLADDIDLIGRKFGNRRFWIGLGVGSGGVLPFNGKPEALVNGYDDRNHSPAVPGIGWAGLLHAAPTIGFAFNPNWAIALEGRNQYILRPKGVSQSVSASGAHAVTLRVLHYTKQARARFFYGLGGGGGEGIREIVQVKTADTSKSAFQDTVLVGPYLATAAGGFIYEVSTRVSWIAQLNFYVGFPKMGLALDLNTGVQINFGDSSGRAEAARKAAQESVSGSIEDEDEPRN